MYRSWTLDTTSILRPRTIFVPPASKKRRYLTSDHPLLDQFVVHQNSNLIMLASNDLQPCNELLEIYSEAAGFNRGLVDDGVEDTHEGEISELIIIVVV